MNTKLAREWIDNNQGRMCGVSKKIWSTPETAFRERESYEVLVNILKEEGFLVEERFGGIPTAFRATYGSGSPVIGLLAEYDALPDLSQKVSTKKEEMEEGAPGHGCGHNLMAAACLSAALALKEGLESEEEATIVLYGCPAEEILNGKGFMAREGAFKELDLAISWHPSSTTSVQGSPMTALESGEFFFKGRTAHAAGDPENGRSALDAVELMDIGANYLREHVTDDVRIHYQITNGGGAPNIVPDKASVLYFTRAKDRRNVLETYERVKKCADGASTMTETSYELKSRGGCYEILINETLNTVMEAVLLETPEPVYTEEELAFAEELNKTSPSYERASKADDYESIKTKSIGIRRGFGGGSTDVGDVSHIVPLVMFTTATHNSLAAGHSWHITASSGHSIGEKGMLYAARSMVEFVRRVLEDPEILINAKEEFDRSTKDDKYICPVTDDMKVEDFLV
jgi:aminobenzoyl-glutamate utilization protein B